MFRRHGRGLRREPPTGRLAHLLIQCGWLRRALPPRHVGQPLLGLTVHRVLPRYTVQPPALHPTKSPSAALIGYDGTALFHHAAYAASYAARTAMWQATPLATPGAVPTTRRLDMLNGGLQEQARISGREISFACDAIMYEQYVILYYIVGPTCRGLNGHVRASLEI